MNESTWFLEWELVPAEPIQLIGEVSGGGVEGLSHGLDHRQYFALILFKLNEI